jgi:hypothetical protein
MLDSFSLFYFSYVTAIIEYSVPEMYSSFHLKQDVHIMYHSTCFLQLHKCVRAIWIVVFSVISIAICIVLMQRLEYQYIHNVKFSFYDIVSFMAN